MLDNFADACHYGGTDRQPMEDYLTIAQVAELLQLSDKTIYRLAQSGELPGFKVGGSWRFRRRDIDDWAAEQIRSNQEKK